MAPVAISATCESPQQSLTLEPRLERPAGVVGAPGPQLLAQVRLIVFDRLLEASLDRSELGRDLGALLGRAAALVDEELA